MAGKNISSPEPMPMPVKRDGMDVSKHRGMDSFGRCRSGHREWIDDRTSKRVDPPDYALDYDDY